MAAIEENYTNQDVVSVMESDVHRVLYSLFMHPVICKFGSYGRPDRNSNLHCLTELFKASKRKSGHVKCTSWNLFYVI